MNIAITRATRPDTAVLRHLYELYSYDFSEMTHTDIDDSGLYANDAFFAGQLRDPDRMAFLVRVDGRLAGFAWVLKTSLFPPDQRANPGDEHYLVEEFFILRKFRRQGIGESVAAYLFDEFPGTWEVSEIVENIPAQAFWRKIIHRYAQGRYVEVALDSDRWQGPVQVFRSRRLATGG